MKQDLQIFGGKNTVTVFYPLSVSIPDMKHCFIFVTLRQSAKAKIDALCCEAFRATVD